MKYFYFAVFYIIINCMYSVIVMACFCILIAVIDLKTYRIPDALLVSFAIVMTLMEGNQPYELMYLRLLTAIMSFLLFCAIWHYTKGIGFGDVKYAALLGYLLGPEMLIPAFIFTALLSFFVYFTGIIIYHWPKTLKIPYAPFLSAGAVMSIINNLNLTGGVI